VRSGYREHMRCGMRGAGDPGRAAADLPGIVVLRPGLVALFGAGGDGISPPQMLASLSVPAVDEATNAKLGAGNASHQHAVHNQRRNRKRKALPPFCRLRLPQLLTVFGVIRDDVGIQRGAEDLAVVNRRALVGYAATDNARGLRRPIERLFPDLLAGGDIDRDGRLGVGDVHHVVVDDRLRLLAPIVVEAEAPHRHQTLDALLIDLLERAITLLVIAHAIGENVVSRAAVAVFLEVIKCLRRGAAAEEQQNTSGQYESLHGCPSLNEPLLAALAAGRTDLLRERIIHSRRTSREPR